MNTRALGPLRIFPATYEVAVRGFWALAESDNVCSDPTVFRPALVGAEARLLASRMISTRLNLEPPWSAQYLKGTPEEGERLSHWMAQDYLVETWNQAWSPERWTETLHGFRESRHTRAFLVERANEPFAYVEVYRLLDSGIARFDEWGSDDLGFHIAVVQRELTGQGLGSAFVPHLIQTLFEQSRNTRRIAVEPHVNNLVSRRVFERSGLIPVREIQLPHKKAVLQVCRRAAGTHVA
ncbi:GNAT family N-acetyltransferase [Streptomyces sp. NPDC127033]|uniref:GNAT family N-acetyltransferase n=1 Tax=Streptomyces sp. NPDC127033 TaxID=3347110 RepID=UPI003659E964